MRNILKRVVTGLATILLLLTQSTSFLSAQVTTGSGNGFRISPVRAEYTIEKGSSQNLTINVENPTDSNVIARPAVNDFVASENEDGEPRLILDEATPPPKNSFKKLVRPLTDTQLGPRERKDVNVTINVPEDVSSGGYYGAIRFIPNAVAGSGNVGLTASVGTIFLIRVPGNLVEKLDLVELTAAAKTKRGEEDVYTSTSFLTSGKVAVATRLKNSGDIHLQPFGKGQVKDVFGKVVQEFEFNNAQLRSNILPESTRKFTNDLSDRKWFGRYTIEINLGYSQGSGDLISARSTFWYIPRLALYAFLLGLIVLVGAVYWVIRRYKARKQHKHDVNKQKK